MTRPTDRYAALYDVLDAWAAAGKPHVEFMEIGTHNGTRAAALCRYWREATGRTFSYTGFDLFEDADPEAHAHEFLKSTPAGAEADAARRLAEAGALIVSTVKGDTRVTLPKFIRKAFETEYAPDLVFVDGGHSRQTVASDWACVSGLVRPWTAVLFDDYFANRPGCGCKDLVDDLADEGTYRVELLDPEDTVPGTGLRIRMAKVTQKV